VKLSIILTLIKLALAIVQWLERARLKAEGKAEAYVEAKEIHDRRVAEAAAARADADELDGLHDPFNRDTSGRH
jgi:Tfp pilus assembly protein PilO